VRPFFQLAAGARQCWPCCVNVWGDRVARHIPIEGSLLTSKSEEDWGADWRILKNGEDSNWQRDVTGEFQKNAEGSTQKAALPTPPPNPLESSSRMVARGFANQRFLVGLRVRHARIDALENLFFRESGIFQPADFRAAHCALAF
jgi:hypothetical protein